MISNLLKRMSTHQFILLSLLLVNLTTGYEKCAFQVQDMKLAPTDEAWFKRMSALGWHAVEHGDCNNCGTDKAFGWMKPPQGRTIFSRMCYNMNVTTQYGQFNVPFRCRYNVIEDETCEMDFSGTSVADKLIWAGTVKIVSTDNSTYIAGTCCLLGKENFYWILSTSEFRQLKPGVYEELKAHFARLGFKHNNVAVKGKSPFYYENFNSVPC